MTLKIGRIPKGRTMLVAGSVRISEDEGRLVHLGFFAIHRDVVLQNLQYEIYRSTVDGRYPANHLVDTSSHYLQGFIHPRWCSIFSTVWSNISWAHLGNENFLSKKTEEFWNALAFSTHELFAPNNNWWNWLRTFWVRRKHIPRVQP